MCHLHSKSKKVRILTYIGLFIGGITLAVVFAFLFGFIVQYIWNSVMVAVFGLGAISFWQAFGLIILAKIFFGGHGPGHSHKRPQFVENKINHVKGHMSPEQHSDYKRFWEEEGREAFDDFMARKSQS